MEKTLPTCFFLKESVAFCHLGRHGDLILMAPAWKWMAEQTGKPTVVFVSSYFSNTLEGMTYIEPVILNGFNFFKDLPRAKEIAEESFDVVICPKWWDLPDGKFPNKNPLADKITLDVRGQKITIDKERWSSYQTSQWEAAGFTVDQMRDWPLVFDNRSPEREKALVSKYLRGTKPILLVNLSGISSPFSGSYEVMREIMRFSDKFQILDIGAIRAERIYDLLGLYDIAAGLVTIDTATLHLARASNVPMIALINDGGMGSVVLGNCLREIRYKEALAKKYLIGMTLETMYKNWQSRKTIVIDPIRASDKKPEDITTMNETSKSMRRRLKETENGVFDWAKIFQGNAIDVGAGPDKLEYPGCNCIGFDQKDGDANHLSSYFKPESFDLLHGSQALEHMIDPVAALRDWISLVKPGGFIVQTVPSWELYEGMIWPSRFNPDHKSTFSLWQKGSPAPHHCKLPEWLEQFGCEIVLCRLVDDNFDYRIGTRKDQTWIEEDGVECWIEFILKRK